MHSIVEDVWLQEKRGPCGRFLVCGAYFDLKKTKKTMERKASMPLFMSALSFFQILNKKT